MQQGQNQQLSTHSSCDCPSLTSLCLARSSSDASGFASRAFSLASMLCV